MSGKCSALESRQELLARDTRLAEDSSESPDLEFAVERDHATARATAHYDMAATLANLLETMSVSTRIASAPDVRGNLGMDFHLERSEQDASLGVDREFLQIQFRRFFQIREGLWHAFALCGATGLRIKSNITPFRSRAKNG